MEDKNRIVLYLKWLLKETMAGQDIMDMLFDEKHETVIILYEDGSSREVNVAADSGRAIIVDVLKVIH